MGFWCVCCLTCAGPKSWHGHALLDSWHIFELGCYIWMWTQACHVDPPQWAVVNLIVARFEFWRPFQPKMAKGFHFLCGHISGM